MSNIQVRQTEELAHGGAGGTERAGHETAIVAQVRATIEAKHLMAVRFPRDWETVRVKLLQDCKRPGFAEAAIYRKPIGGGKHITGASIRFAEACFRYCGNLDQSTTLVHDDDKRRIVRVTVTDIESNASYTTDVIVEKTVERSRPREGARVIGVRTNSRQEQVFIVEATEDELAIKQSAQVSKALRSAILRLVPADLVEDATAAIRKTKSVADAKDPEAAKKSVVDAFAGFGIFPKDLEEYLGGPLASMSSSDIDKLREIYVAIKEKATSWRELIAEVREAKEPKKTKGQALKDKMAEKADKVEPGPNTEDAVFEENLDAEPVET